MNLISGEINLSLTCSANYLISAATGAKTLQYLIQNLPSSSNLSTQDNSNPLEKLKSGFKQKTNSNEYRSNVSTQT